MSDLISRSALIEKLEEDFPLNWTDSEMELQSECDYMCFIDMVKNQPTAYDVDAVVKEIEKLERPHSAEEWFADVKLRKAIKIIRKGGV